MTSNDAFVLEPLLCTFDQLVKFEFAQIALIAPMVEIDGDFAHFNRISLD